MTSHGRGARASSVERRQPGGAATAVARSNIALAKYWGKRDVRLNVPAVPSVSMTVEALVTETTVELDRRLMADVVVLDGRRAGERERERVSELLDRLRKLAGTRLRARVTTRNDFPTAAGLASSASGFAALAGAAQAALGLQLDGQTISQIARRSSASAARSVYGGFVRLAAGKKGQDVAAEPLFGKDHWDLRLVIALTHRGPKDVGSTEGMERSKETSPYYEAWLRTAPKLATKIEAAIKRRDLASLGPLVEQSSFSFHACAMTSTPPVVYFRAGTMNALETVRSLREQGVLAFATMDAGPHVKVLALPDDAPRIARALRRTEGVERVVISAIGDGLAVRREGVIDRRPARIKPAARRR